MDESLKRMLESTGLPEWMFPKEIEPLPAVESPQAAGLPTRMAYPELGPVEAVKTYFPKVTGAGELGEEITPPTFQLEPEALAGTRLPNVLKEGWKAWQQSRGPLSLAEPEIEEIPLEAPREQYIGTPTGYAEEEVPAEPPQPTVVQPVVVTPPPREGLTAEEAEVILRKPAEGVMGPMMGETGPAIIEAPATQAVTPEVTAVPEFPAITAEQFGLKPEDYWINQLKSWRASRPKTLDEAMRRAGVEPTKYTLEGKGHWLTNMLINFGLALGGRDPIAERRQIETDLQKKYGEQVEYVMKYLADDEKLFFAQQTMEMQLDSQRRKGLQDMLTAQVEANPYVKQNPNWWRAMSIAFRVPKEYMESWLDSKKQPDGTYKDLWMTPYEQMIKEWAYKASAIKTMFPDIPDDVAKHAAIFGEFPDYVKDFEKWINHEIVKNRDNPQRVAELRLMLAKHKANFEALGYDVLTFNEILKRLPIPKDVAQQHIADFIAVTLGKRFPGMEKLYQERVKGYYELLKERAKAATEGTKELKPSELQKLWSYETMTTGPFAVGAIAFPDYRAGMEKDPMFMRNKIEEVRDATARLKAGKRDKEDIALVNTWVDAQKKRLSQLNKQVLAVVEHYKVNDPDFLEEVITHMEHPEYGKSPASIIKDIKDLYSKSTTKPKK